MFNYLFIYLAGGGVGRECSSLFGMVVGLIVCFRFDALTWLRAFVWAVFLCVSMLGVASGAGMELAGYGTALGHPVVCSVGRSWAVVPVMVLLFVALWFSTKGFVFFNKGKRNGKSCLVFFFVFFFCSCIFKSF